MGGLADLYLAGFFCRYRHPVSSAPARPSAIARDEAVSPGTMATQSLHRPIATRSGRPPPVAGSLSPLPSRSMVREIDLGPLAVLVALVIATTASSRSVTRSAMCDRTRPGSSERRLIRQGAAAASARRRTVSRSCDLRQIHQVIAPAATSRTAAVTIQASLCDVTEGGRLAVTTPSGTASTISTTASTTVTRPKTNELVRRPDHRESVKMASPASTTDWFPPVDWLLHIHLDVPPAPNPVLS
jgi:hypothetical protein